MGMRAVAAEVAKATGGAGRRTQSVTSMRAHGQWRIGRWGFVVTSRLQRGICSGITCGVDADNRRDLPIVERWAARLVVIDAADRILLLHVQDLSNPQFGRAWELPGGGMEADETFVDAATRELREETGLEIRPECVEAPRWRRQIEYVYRGVCRHQRELVALVRISESSPSTYDSLRVGAEKEDVIEARWWSIEQIMASSERLYPRSLPTLLPRFLAGESLEEPLEIWTP
jgi:8-oxo-dGTP pyrophosphatase MutT (NUDIX family)